MKCPRCNKLLLKQITLEYISYTCLNNDLNPLNKDCYYSRKIPRSFTGKKIFHQQILETKVNAYHKDTGFYGNLIVIIAESQSQKGKVVLEIQSNLSYGKWSWYLGHLLCLNTDETIDDTLWLDNNHYVKGMKKVYQEIINAIILKGISI